MYNACQKLQSDYQKNGNATQSFPNKQGWGIGNGPFKSNRRQEKRKKETKRSMVEISSNISVTIINVNG